MRGSIPGPRDHDLSRRQTFHRLSPPGARLLKTLTLDSSLPFSGAPEAPRPTALAVLCPACRGPDDPAASSRGSLPFPSFVPGGRRSVWESKGAPWAAFCRRELAAGPGQAIQNLSALLLLLNKVLRGFASVIYLRGHVCPWRAG